MTVKVSWKGQQVAQLVKKAAFHALEDVGEFILDEANKDVPHDEGTLQASGIVTGDSDKMHVAISYDTPYAVRLHENPQYRFQKGRKGKWLENAVKVNAQQIKDYVGKKIQEAHKGGGSI